MDFKEEYQKALERAKKGLPIDEVFPELKESDDERIRKELIGMINECTNWPHKKEYVKYLEKQKEYISNNFDEVWEREDCSEIIAEGEKLTPEFKVLFKKVCHAFFDKGVELTKKQKEHKPADLSELMVHKEPYIAPVPIPIVADEQKPVEWSEEDEVKLNDVIRLIENSGNVKSIIKHYTDFLKALPERFSLQPNKNGARKMGEC